MMFQTLLHDLLHFDAILLQLSTTMGMGIYALLFLIILLETGLVIMPFLPGDSLLFTAGTLAAVGVLDVHALFLLLAGAAILGDSINYYLGKKLGLSMCRGVFRMNPTHLEKTEQYFKKYGAKTIIIARFIPIVRTMAPFLAGIARMNYRIFFRYNCIGGLLWAGVLIYSGYFFANIPLVRANYGSVILTIIIISLLPVLYEVIKAKRFS